MRHSEATWPTTVLNDEHTGYEETKRPIRLQKENTRLENRTETSSESVFVSVTDNGVDFTLNACNYSSWLRLTRIVAWVTDL